MVNFVCIYLVEGVKRGVQFKSMPCALSLACEIVERICGEEAGTVEPIVPESLPPPLWLRTVPPSPKISEGILLAARK